MNDIFKLFIKISKLFSIFVKGYDYYSKGDSIGNVEDV